MTLAEDGPAPQSWYRIYPDTNFSEQEGFNILKGQVGVGAASGLDRGRQQAAAAVTMGVCAGVGF